MKMKLNVQSTLSDFRFTKNSKKYSSFIELFPYICMLFLIVLNKNKGASFGS